MKPILGKPKSGKVDKEAHLYLIMNYLAMGANVSQPTVDRCTALAPKSCVAARCRSHAK